MMYFVTYNCSGFTDDKIYYINYILTDIHVLFLQELWLIDSHHYKLNDAFKNCNVFSVSGVHDISNLHGRPYGGCAIIIARCFTEKKMIIFLTIVSKIRRAKRNTACQMDGHTDETDVLQIFAVKYNLIYKSVGYDCIDMENILADNENDIIHMCSIISNHNSEGHLHMIDKDTLVKAVFDMKTGESDGFDGLSSDYF